MAETHSAVVFFAGDRAYKLKKPVNLGFLDFTTAAARAAACLRETELNRRFSPDVYLGVAELRDATLPDVETLVVMRRMPAARRLSALVRSGAVVGGPVRQVARILAAQHGQARRSDQISAEGSGPALARRWDDNLGQAASCQSSLLDAGLIAEIRDLASRFVAGRGPLFDARISTGRILDGHGDLLADDIYCLDDGPRVLDCLDFDDRLRWVDGVDDAAFLAMDLERLGAAGLARQFADWYCEFSGDPAPGSLRHHYLAYRAFVRAKVACVRAGQGVPASAGEARLLATLTIRHLRAGSVELVVGGLPGTGKSSLASAIAGQLGWTVLSSDRIRKELAGLAADEPAAAGYRAGIYTAEWTERTYAELLRRAELLLGSGESVIADASFSSAAHRAGAAAVAAQANAGFTQLLCTAPHDLARQRISERAPGPSDADGEIAGLLAATFAPWPEATTIDTTGSALALALAAVRPHGPEHVWRPARPVLAPG